MRFVPLLLLFILIYSPVQAKPPYCSKTDQPECLNCTPKPLSEVTHFAENFSGEIKTEQALKKLLEEYAFSNLLEEVTNIKQLYPEIGALKMPETCQDKIKSNPNMQHILTYLKEKHVASNPQKRRAFEQKAFDDYQQAKKIWDRLRPIKKDINKCIARMGLLNQKKFYIKKQILFIGDKRKALKMVDDELSYYGFLYQQNLQKLKLALPIVAKNPLLVKSNPLETYDSIEGLSPSKLYKSFEQGRPDFPAALSKKIKTIESSLKNICSGKSKLYHHQALMNDLLFQRYRAQKAAGIDPTSEQHKLQNLHCSLWNKDPPDRNKRKYYSMATTGIFLTGLALTPFTGGASLGAALLWTAGISGTVLGGLETYDSWKKNIDSQALYSAQLTTPQHVADDYNKFRNNAALSILDVSLYSIDGYRLYAKYKAAKVAIKPARHYVHNFYEFRVHTQLHIRRVEKIGLYIYKNHPEQFKNVDRDLAQKFLQKHDQGKVNYNLWKAQGEDPIIKQIYKYYNVPKQQITPQQFTEMKHSIQKLNDMDAKIAKAFFKEHKLIKPNGELSDSAQELLRLEHLADLVDRGKNIVSPEEFAKKAMIPASKMFKNTFDTTVAAEAEAQYAKIIKGLDYTDRVRIHP